MALSPRTCSADVLPDVGWTGKKTRVAFFPRYPEVVRMFTKPKTALVDAERALQGRESPISSGGKHAVLGNDLHPPFPGSVAEAVFAMGCFWGAERALWQTPGVYVTAVGYAGGYTPNPTYEEVCSGFTGHAEAVLVAYHPDRISYQQLLTVFWESHDPTQGMRQGNDIGSQYRSAIYWTTPAERDAALASKQAYAQRLRASGYSPITTEITEAGPFYYAEEWHQQYLAKNPAGYCGLEGTGVSCPVGLTASI